MAKWSYIKRVEPEEEGGERFVLARSATSRSGWVNYWHITKDGHEYLFSFFPNQRFNKHRPWSKELFLELEEDLRSANPSVKVLRFAVDGNVIFVENGFGMTLPTIPESPKKNSQGQIIPASVEEKKALRRLLDKKKRQEKFAAIEEEMAKAKEKAPYWLYGKFSEDGKEFVWKLTPDEPERQGIQPGDWVLVWSKDTFAKVKCTRIEKVDRRRRQPEHPKYRVKKKL